MELFRNRPLARLSAVYVMASVLFVSAAASVKLLFIAVITVVAILFLLAVLFIKNARISSARRHLATVMTCAAVAVIAVSVAYFRIDAKNECVLSLSDSDAMVTGIVTDVIYENSYSGSYIIDITKVNDEDSSFAVRLETEFALDLSVGDEIRANVIFSPLSNSGAFDEASYYFSKGVSVGARIESAEEIEVIDKHGGILSEISKLRARIAARLFVSLESAGGDNGMTAALLVGDRDGLHDIVYRDFKYSGASHLLAVSGMHLSILLGGIEVLLRRLTMHKTPRTILLMILTVAYMALTGFSSSVLRAGLMLIIYQLSHFARREPDRVTSLFVSVSLIIIVSPYAAAETGLLLSFSAMLACIFATELAKPRKSAGKMTEWGGKGRICKFLSDAVKLLYSNFATSFAALIFTLPVLWVSFGRVSLMSPLSTLLLAIPITLILYLSPFVLITFRFQALSAIVSYPCALLCRLSGKIVAFLSKLRGAEIILTTDTIFEIVICATLVVCITVLLVCRCRAATIAGTVIIACFFSLVLGDTLYRALYDGNTVTYINNGKNDGFTVFDGTSSLVCDISDGGWSITSTAVEKAREQRASHVNVYMLTHLHYRHARTVSRLCQREYVDEILLPLPETENDAVYFDSICAVADEYGIAVRMYERGESITFGDIVIDTATAIIPRSTHPTIALAIKSEDEYIAYVGSSVHESEIYDRATDMCRSADRIIFGIHGPVYKSGADYYLNDDAHVIFADRNVFDYLTEYNRFSDSFIYNEQK